MTVTSAPSLFKSPFYWPVYTALRSISPFKASFRDIAGSTASPCDALPWPRGRSKTYRYRRFAANRQQRHVQGAMLNYISACALKERVPGCDRTKTALGINIVLWGTGFSVVGRDPGRTSLRFSQSGIASSPNRSPTDKEGS